MHSMHIYRFYDTDLRRVLYKRTTLLGVFIRKSYSTRGVKLMASHNSRRFAPTRAKHRAGRRWMCQIYAFDSRGKIVSRVMDL